MAFLTPLRYPGGKARLGPWIAWTMRKNGLSGGTYVEPYAGGAGAALYLLQNRYVHKIVINDIDPAIHAFWHCVLYDTDRFVRKIQRTPVTMDSWRRQQKVLEQKDSATQLQLGFAAFFLNRTNRSGILSGGVIGGQKQDAKYKLDARFNKPELISRIRKIAQHRNQVELHSADALELLEDIGPGLERQSLVYLDPPYYNKASQLYRNFYEHSDHIQVSESIRTLQSPWMITYDNCTQISDLYDGEEQCQFALTYSTHMERPKATELMIFRGIELPANPFLSRSSRPYPSTWQ